MTSFQALHASRELKPVLTSNKVCMPLVLIKWQKICDNNYFLPVIQVFFYKTKAPIRSLTNPQIVKIT